MKYRARPSNHWMMPTNLVYVTDRHLKVIFNLIAALIIEYFSRFAAYPNVSRFHMEIDLKILNDFFEEAGLSIPAEKQGVGRDLHYAIGLKRTVVVQFAEADFPDNISKTLVSICSIDSDWFLVNRFGSYNATKYVKSAHATLVNRLIQAWPQLHDIGDDIYLVSGDGKALLLFGHHMREDGMSIFFNDIEKAGLLISKLNVIGAEFEFFSNDG
jgi:hypothetical protein